MRMKKGSLVVIEGLDGTGKSTLADAVAEHVHGLTVIHSPSGGGAIGEAVYQITEENRTMLPFTRQFLHLAAHTEAYEHDIIPALGQGGVLMDRNWCSAFAYGMAGGLRKWADLWPDDWYEIVQYPTQGVVPDLVVLCLEPHVEDDHNTPELEQAYFDLKRRLEKDTSIKHVRVMPRLSKKQSLIAFMQMLQEAGLTRR